MVHVHRLLGSGMLIACYSAAMIDVAALPIWTGGLISTYGWSAERAGILLTVFLLSSVVSGGVGSRLLTKLKPHRVVPAAFLGASAAFFIASLRDDFLGLLVLHLLAGAMMGLAISTNVGVIGHRPTAHRLFSLSNMAFGAFGLVFMAIMPRIVAELGVPILFKVFAGIMVCISILSLLLYPKLEAQPPRQRRESNTGTFPSSVKFGIAGIILMGLVQSMIFSFVMPSGLARGFGVDAISAVFAAVGMCNVFPGFLSAVLERRVSARIVIMSGPLVQGLVALVITGSVAFAPFAVATVVFTGIMLFTFNFVFSMVAAQEASKRAVAFAPAAAMLGAAFGPIVGGFLAAEAGFAAIGIAAAALDILAFSCLWRLSLGTNVALSPRPHPAAHPAD